MKVRLTLKLYQNKEIKTSFVIICHDNSLSLLSGTANSIKSRYYDNPFICVANGSANAEEIANIKKICPAYKGKDTLTSLINVGMRHAPTEWVFIVFAGSNIPQKLDSKFSFYISSIYDVLFPIVQGKFNFIDATWNGMMLNKKAFKEIGAFEETGDLLDIKCDWALRATEKGCKFKGIMGVKVC